MRHFEIHHRRTTFREFLRVAYPHTLQAALLWLPLRIGLIRWPCQTVTCPHSIIDVCVEIDQLPESIRSHLTAISRQVGELGFLDPLIEREVSTGTDGKGLIGTCLRSRHSSGRFMVQAIISLHESGYSQSQEQLITFHTEQRTTGTTNGRPTYNRIPGADATYHPGKSLKTLLAIHEQKLTTADASSVLQLHNQGDMIRLVDALLSRYFNHMVQRGLFTEVSRA